MILVRRLNSTNRRPRNDEEQAEQTAYQLREAGWPIVYIEFSDDGSWRAVAEDWAVRDALCHAYALSEPIMELI